MGLIKNINEDSRQAWIQDILSVLPKGARILDAGAGELKNRKYCQDLDYVAQDFCQYQGSGGRTSEGLQSKSWDTSEIDIVSDITEIPAPDVSFDAVLCSEVLEHVLEPTHTLDEFTRLLKPCGKLILTAPFASIVHMAPYYYCSGFSKYWYEHHLTKRGFHIEKLVPNGDYYDLLLQEIIRLGSLERHRGNWAWSLAYAYRLIGLLYFKLRSNKRAENLACFCWQCVAVKQ